MPDMNTFRIIGAEDGQIQEKCVEPGMTLAQHLYLAGAFTGRPLCSGAGRCGLCQVRFMSGAPDPLPREMELITTARLDKGWRLTCCRQPVPGSLIRADLDRTGPDQQSPGLRSVDQSAGCPDASLGIDLGTTSVQWLFRQGGLALRGTFHNPQLGAGSEVMSRLALASMPSGAARLRQAVVRSLRKVLDALPCLPSRICLAGNSCMTFLALGMDSSGLAHAPYHLDWPGAGEAVLDEGLPGVYIPPLLAPFVGGDVSAGLLALAFRSGPDGPPEPPYLLADLGTNGEFALVLPDGDVLVASVPMGPALEGVGMAHGMLAGPGAAVAFAVSPGGLVPVLFEGAPPADGLTGSLKGVSGTGYLSLLSRLRGLGAVSERGSFSTSASSPLSARVLAGLREHGGEPCLEVAGMLLMASDVEALLKVKAAFSVAVKMLLAKAGLTFAGLASVCLAGALGEHVRPGDLETLGFFPPGGAGKVLAVGNTSLEGACLAAESEEARRWLSGLPNRTGLVEVVSAPDFQSMYLEAMRFTYAG
jgi:uncharacterized 2Fe-2S/4Fe-4S cluster protein (DUF4445 family)